MAQFYADIQGNRGRATRMGTKKTGIAGHIRGWERGNKMNNNWAWVLSHYPLKELRRRQDICNQQIAVAHKTKNTDALERCQTMANTLAGAIMEKTK